MKRPKDTLYALIQSLSWSEEVVFRTRAREQGRENPQYLILFDAMKNLDLYQDGVYNESKLKEALADKAVARYIPVAKSDLYEKILDILVDVRKPEHQEYQLYRSIQQVKVLTQKGLYHQAVTRMDKALDQAENLEAFAVQLGILRQKRELHKLTLPATTYLTQLVALEQSAERIHAKLDRITQLEYLVERAFTLGKLAHTERLAVITEIETSLPQTNHPSHQSTRETILHHRLHRLLAVGQSDLLVAQDHAQLVLSTLESRPELFADDELFVQYVETLLWLGFSYILEDSPDQAQATIERLESFSTTYLPQATWEVLVQERTWYLQMGLAQKFPSAQTPKLIREIRKHLPNVQRRMNSRILMGLRYTLAVYHLYAGKYEAALPWILQLTQERITSARPDLHCYAWLLLFFAHEALGNLDVIDAQRPSARRYLKKHSPLSPLDMTLMLYFRRLAQCADQGEKISLRDKTEKKLAELFADPEHQRLSFYFDVPRWFEAMNRGTTVHALLSAKSSESS